MYIILTYKHYITEKIFYRQEYQALSKDQEALQELFIGCRIGSKRDDEKINIYKVTKPAAV